TLQSYNSRTEAAMRIPRSARYVVIGAGIHGLSTGWHLAMELERRKQGTGKDVVVLDKTGVGAGASGIACGCVRNLYMTEPLHAVLTGPGRIACDAVIWGLGAWTPKHWAILGKPAAVECRYPDGGTQTKDMWTYWRLLEGEVYWDEPYLTAAGLNPPVLHVE